MEKEGKFACYDRAERVVRVAEINTGGGGGGGGESRYGNG